MLNKIKSQEPVPESEPKLKPTPGKKIPEPEPPQNRTAPKPSLNVEVFDNKQQQKNYNKSFSWGKRLVFLFGIKCSGHPCRGEKEAVDHEA